MDLELVRIPRRKEALNLLTGVFLKYVFFLDKALSKSVFAGIFKNRGDSLGIVFNGRHGPVFWSYDVLNHFLPYFNDVTLAFENKCKMYFKLDTGEDIKVQNIFGKQHVFLYDVEHTLSLNEAEWTQFTNNLPCMQKHLTELFISEDLIKNYIFNILSSDEEFVSAPEGLPLHLRDRLFDEVKLFQRWPNGSCS